MKLDTRMIQCFACGALVPDIDGPTHEYMLSAPGCWKLYGEILAKEYSPENYNADSHRITVDTYAVTHPGDKNERRAVQSVNIHLIRLYYLFEEDMKGERLLRIIKNAANNEELHKELVWLHPPSFKDTLNINSILITQDIEKHKKAVRLWGESVWLLWKENHGNAIKSLAKKVKI